MLNISKNDLNLIKKIYGGNINNRIRELDTINETLQKRFIWELIQNAKDCARNASRYYSNQISVDSNNEKHDVDIKVIFDHKERLFIFMHNGFPFTINTLNSLMYKISTKDSEDENTGRFGTGFITSHILSKRVQIKAPFLNEEESLIWYIEATVIREGKNIKQHEDNFMAMEDSKHCYPFDINNKEHKWTQFIYKLKDDLAHQSAEIGIQSLRDNINKVLLFCNNINSIQINDEEPIYASSVLSGSIFNQIRNTQSDFKSLDIIEKTVLNKKFIVASINEPNELYSQKYKKDHDVEYQLKNLKVSIAFEIDSNLNLIDLNQNDTCLFCVFPLIGSEKYQLPFLLNSPNFETTTERDGILLEGQEYDSDNILRNTGLNALIINMGIKIFTFVLNLLIENNFSHFISFTNGLLFDKNTINEMKPFLLKLRSIVETSKIIHDSQNSLQKLNQINFLDFANIKNKECFYDLVKTCFPNSTPTFSECLEWENKFWDNSSIIDLDKFIQNVFIDENSYFHNRLSNLNDENFSFLKKIYLFLLDQENCDSIFLKYKLVLNSNNKFEYLRNLKSSSQYSKDFNTFMKLCPHWNDNIINPQINIFGSKVQKVTLIEAINQLDSYLNSKKNKNDILLLLSFSRYISLLDNENRQKIYLISKVFLKDQFVIPDAIYVNDVDKKLWETCDSLLLNYIYKIIKSKKKIQIDENLLDDLDTFYQLYKSKCQCNLDNILVPNYNLMLTNCSKLKSLSNDIPKKIVDLLGQYIGLKKIAHPKITSIDFKYKYNLSNLIKKLNSKDFYDQNDWKTRLISVLSIMPSTESKILYNIQSNILCLAELFLCSQINSISSDINDESFWKKANKKILQFISRKLQENGSINNLKNFLNTNEKVIYEHLNKYYEIIYIKKLNKKVEVLVPNYNDDFCPSNNIFMPVGVSELFFEFANKIQPQLNIKKDYAHPNIKCDFLKPIDLNQFINTIFKNISDDDLVNDPKIKGAIIDMNKSFNRDEKNSQTKDNDILLLKLYVANIKNRLAEIQNPSECDKKRWAFELIQNAKDSLLLNNQDQVEIFMDLTDNEFIFSHNGAPFTNDSILGLLYKISQGKENTKATGKFGTGFMSTHVLSKTVEVTGNLIDENGKLCGFSAKIYREGLNKTEIEEDFKKMQKELKTDLPLFQKTTFKYKIKSEQSRECAKLGFDHLISHISSVLINCQEIKFININENGNQSRYHTTKFTEEVISNISYNKYQIFKNDTPYQHFIVLEDKDNEINIFIEINDDGMIIPIKDEIDCISVTFPLVGSNKHILPFYLNSPRLEPTTERNALYLSGYKKINGELSNYGKNCKLLKKCPTLFEILISKLESNNCNNIFELSRGLLLSQLPYETFDLKWYTNNFLSKIREKLANNATVLTISGQKVLLKDSFIPSSQIGDDHLQKFVELAERYYENILCEKEAITWKCKVWNTLNIVNIQDLIKKVQDDKSLFDDEKMEYLNEFLLFIKKYDKKLLDSNELIPDMNNDLHCYSNLNGKCELNECKNVIDDIINVLESIGIPWRSTHMNNAINTILLHEDDMTIAEDQIINKTEEDKMLDDDNRIIKSNSFEIIKFVLENDEFRQTMFDFVNQLKLRDYSPIKIKNVKPRIWDFADKYVLKEMIKEISKFQQEKVLELIGFFPKFLLVCKNYFVKEKNFFISSKIFPNENVKLCKLTDLCSKSECIHDYLNPIMKKYFEIDYNEKILHTQINTIKAKNETISDFLSKINEKIDKLPINDKINVAKLLICLLPKEDKNEKPSQRQKLFSIYQQLMNSNAKEVFFDPQTNYSSLWSKSNEILIMHICEKIQKTKNLENFKKEFSIDDEEKCFSILNSLISISSNYLKTYRIIPNQNGQFKLKAELKQDPGIDKDLLEFISYLKPELISEYDFVDSRINIIKLVKIDLIVLIQQLIDLTSDAIKNHKDGNEFAEKFKKIIKVNDPSFFDMISLKDKTEDQKIRYQVLLNAHIQFLKNRLRELDSSSTWKDYQRWPFELIQNANDTLFYCINGQETNNKKVKIFFEFSDKKVTFRHNGNPFTNESLFSLLFQCSEGKENNIKSTGQFGSGFMSTFILSRIVHISGDVQVSNEIYGFSVTMHRDGTDTDELKKGVEKMEKDFKRSLPRQYWTSFEYLLPEESIRSQKAYEQGLIGLKNHLASVLIFNPTIESVTIKTNDEELTYEANHEEGHIQTVSVTKNLKKYHSFKFISFDLTDKFNNSIDITINSLLQIDERNSIVTNSSQKFLFLSYPLLGSEQFCSPIIINSINFEPEKERNNIIIETNINESNKKSKKDEESLESLKNKFILKKSIDLFEKIIEYALNIKCTDLHNLCIGLKYDSENKYIQNHFIDTMRNVILNQPIFETNFGLLNSKKILIPFIKKYDDFQSYSDSYKDYLNEKNKKAKAEKYETCTQTKINIYNDFYDIISQLSNDNKSCVKLQNCQKWLSNLWDSFPSKMTIEDVIKIISKCDMVFDINLREKYDAKSKIKFIKQFLNFIGQLHNCNNILANNKLLINENKQFVLRKDIYYFKLIPVFFEMLSIVNYDYNEEILHSEICELYANDKIYFDEFSVNKSIDEIKKHIDESNALNFIPYIIENNKKRELMFKYTCIIYEKEYDKKYIKKCDINHFQYSLIEMFDKIDKIVIDLLVKRLERINIKANIDFLVEFIKFLITQMQFEKFNQSQIIPNQNFKLCCPKNLFDDYIQDENVKNVLMDVFNIDLKEKLIHEKFNELFTLKIFRFNDISDSICIKLMNKKFLSNFFQKTDKIAFYSIIVQYSKPDISCINQIKNLIQYFFNVKIDKIENTEYWPQDLTSKVCDIVIEDIVSWISKFSTLDEIISNIKNDNNDLIPNLQILYQFTTIGKIFLNRKNELKKNDEINLLYDDKLDQSKMEELLKFYNKFKGSKKINKKILHKSIELSEELKKSIKKIDLNILSKKIISFLSKNKSTINNELKIDFLQFVKTDIILEKAFSSLIDDELNKHKDFLLDLLSSCKGDERLFDKELFLQFIGMERNRDTGYKGEAYVYERLLENKMFSLVKWNAMTDDKRMPCVKLDNNHVYHIQENGEHYDIYAEGHDGEKYYFEVKSTSWTNYEKYYYYLSQDQFYSANNIKKSNEQFILAFVSDVNGSHPIVFFEKSLKF